MPYFRKKVAYRLAGIALLLTLGGCGLRSRPEEQVRLRFEQYMAAWERQDVNTVWSLMSPRLKQGNDNNINAFKQSIVSAGFHPAAHKVRSVTVKKGEAIVVADMVFADSTGRSVGSETERCQFVNPDGEWLFDDCQPFEAR